VELDQWIEIVKDGEKDQQAAAQFFRNHFKNLQKVNLFKIIFRKIQTSNYFERLKTIFSAREIQLGFSFVKPKPFSSSKYYKVIINLYVDR
jgi:hypothetical protein